MREPQKEGRKVLMISNIIKLYEQKLKESMDYLKDLPDSMIEDMQYQIGKIVAYRQILITLKEMPNLQSTNTYQEPI